MKLVLHNGEIKEVDTSFIFSNQYNTTDGKRVHDTDVKYIIDDVRLGEFYCGGGKQGTYDEVVQAIAEERNKINKCHDCWWFHEYTRIEDECHRHNEEIRDGNKKIVINNSTTVYEISCAYKPNHERCVHDIDDTPKLFREATQCFFCEYPDGIPDMKPLKQFMIDNADRYGIVPYWSNEKLSIDNSFTHEKKFGSYKFEARWSNGYFELENARNHFRFYVDVEKKQYILSDYSSYKIAKKLTEHKCEYDYKTKEHKSYDEPIKNYDKFAEWFWQIIDDFMEQEYPKIIAKRDAEALAFTNEILEEIKQEEL